MQKGTEDNDISAKVQGFLPQCNGQNPKQTQIYNLCDTVVEILGGQVLIHFQPGSSLIRLWGNPEAEELISKLMEEKQAGNVKNSKNNKTVS